MYYVGIIRIYTGVESLISRAGQGRTEQCKFYPKLLVEDG